MKYNNTDILSHINKIIKQEHGTRVELDNLLIDSGIDSFGYAIFFLELEDKYNIEFTPEYVKDIDYKKFKVSDLIEHIHTLVSKL